MKDGERECLSQDNFDLFHRGACHVFAATLKTTLDDEGYSLRRVTLQKQRENPIDAYHVFASKGEFMVDVDGIKKEKDYLAWLTARHRESRLGKIFLPKVTVHETSESELLTHHRDDAYRGSVNLWSLFCGQDFIDVVRDRIAAFIKHRFDSYRVSVLEAGLHHDESEKG